MLWQDGQFTCKEAIERILIRFELCHEPGQLILFIIEHSNFMFCRLDSLIDTSTLLYIRRCGSRCIRYVRSSRYRRQGNGQALLTRRCSYLAAQMCDIFLANTNFLIDIIPAFRLAKVLQLCLFLAQRSNSFHGNVSLVLSREGLFPAIRQLLLQIIQVFILIWYFLEKIHSFSSGARNSASK